ncbi:MAG TPA: hypothetical protein VFS21_27795 [Roseiflexaceae bacterium]|nr:hypothetical protein [Roseiflexaceae bacterium]
MKSRKLLFVAGPALGHIMRIIAVANVMKSEYVVSLATDGGWEDVFRTHGYDYKRLAGTLVDGALESSSLSTPLSRLQQTLIDDISLLRQYQPDLIVMDWRPTMRLAAAIVGIPCIAIVNPHVTRAYRGRRSAPSEHPIVKRFGQQFGDMLMPILEPIFQRVWAKPYRQLAQMYGVKGWNDLRDYAIGDTTLYPDLPSLNPVRPNSGVFVGPITLSPAITQLPPLRSPVLYITAGSEKLHRFAENIAQIVDPWPGSVVVTLGGHPAREAWPAHWIVRDYVDLKAIYTQDVDVVWLYHGGNGSSYQLIKQWVESNQTRRSSILTFHVEHQWNKAKIQQLGLSGYSTSIHKISQIQNQIRLREELFKSLENHLDRPPVNIVHEIKTYSNSAQLAAREIQKWL